MYFYRHLNHENSLSIFLLVSFSTSVYRFSSIPVLLARDAHAVCPAGTSRVFSRGVNHTLYNIREYTMPKYI